MRHGVGAARRPDFDLFAGEKALLYVRQHRPAGGQIDMRRPIDFDVRVSGDQFAVGAVQHIQEAVLVGLNHHASKLAANLDIGEHLLVSGVHVEDVVGRVLKRLVRGICG